MVAEDNLKLSSFSKTVFRRSASPGTRLALYPFYRIASLAFIAGVPAAYLYNFYENGRHSPSLIFYDPVAPNSQLQSTFNAVYNN
mmetsp:Transcript_20392/g.34758  ORF Transcript_20392/g.34758 Transcript_20392/m.34758 type:complete len:85 (+) Transcript_20392:17-271(+)